MKKILALALAAIMLLTMSAAAVAQDVDSEKGGSATITISNASKGETYTVYKIFDATVTGESNGGIAYTGEVPKGLEDYFVADLAGNISIATHEVEDEQVKWTDTEIITALQAWAEGTTDTAVASATSDGTELKFTGLEYGYYLVKTSQGDGLVTVTSTNPSASIVDKNTTEPNLVRKEVDDDNVYIGQTVTYTVVFNTSNFHGAGATAKRIVSYTIADTLPSFLSNVTVTSITIDEDANVANTDDQTALDVQQFVNGKITIPWVDAQNNSLYKNGAAIIITYTATVTDEAAIAGAGNTNTVTLMWDDEETSKDENKEPHEDTDKVSATIYTYAIAIKKVDENGTNLAGATFQFPFYVKMTADEDGAYIYAFETLPDTFAEGDSAENYTNTITTPDSGEITIKGLEYGTAVVITETDAPDGYNKLSKSVTVTPIKTSETTTNKTWQIEDGEIVEDSVNTSITVTYTNEKLAATPIAVVNQSGTLLPSTGGVGTTLFYVLGGVLVAAAVVLLVTKKRMHSME